MRNTLLTYIDRFMHDRHSRKVLGSVLLVLAIVVSLTVYWQLRLHGIAITNETYCGYEEHVHTEECYETTLICGLEETVGLTSDWHTHNESCYDEEGNLVCELEECEPHTHTDECYETTLICEIPEHTHTSDCLVDLEADVEDATVWEATLPELMGDLRADIVNIAYSQLGYTESTANYTLAEDGTTKMGYTRYGAWYGGLYYGSEYSDWDSLFVAFCLDYAGIADDFTYNSGAYAWSVDLTTLGYYQTTDTYSPSTGDVAFIDTDADGRANVTAIVVAVDESAQTITVIQGNYTVTDSEGNSTDTVAVVTYSTATEIATQNEIVALSAGSEAEITPVILGYANVTYTTEDGEEVIAEETDYEEVTEEVAEEVIVDETEVDETETEKTEETEEETVLLTTASAVLTYDEYCSEAYSLYTYAMSVTDSTAAASAWSALMSVWDEIDAAYAEGILTDEEYESLNDIMYAYYDEVYAYYTESLGYDPNGVMTADDEEEGEEGSGTSLTATTSKSLIDDASVNWGYDKVTYSNGTFTINLNITFDDLTKEEITAAGYSYVLEVPSGIDIPSSMINNEIAGTVSGYTGTVFTYTIREDGSGGYYIEINFKSNYIDGLSDGANVSGYMKFQATFDVEDNQSNDSSKVIVGDGNATIEIKGSDVETTDPGENWLADLTVVKSAGSYDPDSNTITYTVTIWSESGTEDEITLSDILSVTNFSSYTNTDVSVKSIDVTSVTYYPYYGWGSPITYIDSSSYGTELTSGDSASTGSTYVKTDTDDESKLSITLPALSGKKDPSATNYEGDCYVIKYTVTLDPDSDEYYSDINNTATATTETGSGTVTDYDTEVKTIASHIVSKTGRYSSTTNTITWTITLNTSGSNIAGYVLSDDMLSQAIANSLTITNSTGTTTENEYTITYVKDANGEDTDEIASITFNGVDEVKTTDDEGNEVTTYVNKNTYTITYQTSTDASLGDANSSETNSVTVKDGETVVSGDSETVSVSGGGSLYKEFTSSGSIAENDSQYTRDITWTTIVYVPAGGISKGTVLYDYIGTSSRDTSNHTATETDQWFTYDQLMDETNGFFTGLVTNGITIGTDTVEYSNGENFTLKAYDATTENWVSYSDLIGESSSTYEGHFFTAYSITFENDVTSSGTATLTYTTTVDVTNVKNQTVTSETYYNTAEVGSLTASASYTESKVVTKTDGSGNSNESTVTIDEDGYLTWIVKVYIAAGSTEEYTVIDTLPDGLEFVSATVMMNWLSTKLTIENKSGTLEYNGGEVTLSTQDNGTDVTDVVIKFGSDVYSVLGSDGGYATITYTAHIENFDATKLDGYDVKSEDATKTTYTISPDGGYTNTVKVTWGTDGSDEDSQTQNVEYVVEEESGDEPEETGHDVVSKSGDYDSDTGIISYQVLLNFDGETLNNKNDLTFTDVAKCYVGGSWGTVIALNYHNPVTFYQLCKLETDNDGYYYYIDNKGNTQYYPDANNKTRTITDNGSIYSVTEDNVTTYYYKLDLELAWTYSENESYGWTYHTITSTEIPDETPILVEYEYYVYTIAGNGENLSVTNTATLTGDTSSDSTPENNESGGWKEPTASGGLTADGGMTIIKVDENNTGTTISGTKFAFYKLVDGDWVQVTADDYAKYKVSGDSSGATYSTAGTNPMDENNYLTTVDGAITISKVYDSTNGYVYSWYDPWTLYMVVEVEAAEGYTMLGSNTIYFYWSEYNDSDEPTGTLSYPAGFNSSTTSVVDLNTNPSIQYVENGEITTFSLTKISTSDESTIAGAVFALYEWDISANDWIRIGTYETDKNGEITITYDKNLYTFNKAYKLTEITPASGYNIGWSDVTEFYFWWSSSDASTYAYQYPTGWGESYSEDYSTVYDLAHSDYTVEATNTKTSTTVEVTKVWLDSVGEELTGTDNYTATVQLYYYIGYADGTPVRFTDSTVTSSSLELVTLTTSTGTISDTTATLYSNTNTASLTAGSYNTLSVYKDSLVSAIYGDYTDGYVEVVIKGGDPASSISLVLQYIDGTDYKTLTTVSPSVETVNADGTTYYTLKYSFDDIKSAVEAKGLGSSDIASFCLNLNSIKSAGELQSVKAIGSAKIKASSSDSNWSKSLADVYDSENGTYKTYQSWDGTFWSKSEVAEALQQDGAMILVTYTCTAFTDGYSSGQITVGVQTYNSDTKATVNSESYISVSSASSSSVTVAIDPTSGSNYSNLEWDYFNCIYVNSAGVTGTVTDITVIVPATGTTSEQTYYVASTDTSPSTYSGNQTNVLTTSWTTYAGSKSTLQTDGAVIYITYTSTASDTLSVGLQYYYDSDTQGSADGKISIASTNGETASCYIAVSDLDNIDSFVWDYYNVIYLMSSNNSTTTIESVKVLLPYTLSGTVADMDYTVTLYDPTLGQGSGTVSIYNWSAGQWNAISNRENEPTYNYTAVNDTEANSLFTGYGFLDAIYANTASTVEITLTKVDDRYADLLTKLELIIQGDKSSNYDDIANSIYPTVTGSNGTYVLTYQVSDITDALKSYNPLYVDAASVYADYNSLILALNDSATDFSATVSDLKVKSSSISSDSTYLLTSLIGYEYGIPYTDTNDNGVTVEYTYVLDSANNWTVAVANLPTTYTQGNVTYYRYYYFVETDCDGGTDNKYVTTYSQTEGENGGGEIVITNVKVETTNVTVEKEWQEEDGTAVDADDERIKTGEVYVDLYYYLVAEGGTTIYNGAETEYPDPVDGSSSGDSGDSGTTTTVENWTTGAALYLHGNTGSSRSEVEKDYTPIYIPTGVGNISITIDSNSDTDNYYWYGLYAYKAGEYNVVDDDIIETNWTFNSTPISVVFTHDTDYEVYIMNWQIVDSEILTLSFDYNGYTYTKVKENGVWQSDWTVTEGTITLPTTNTEDNGTEANAASLSNSTSATAAMLLAAVDEPTVTALAVSANSTTMVPIYFGANSAVSSSDDYVTTASVPLGAKVTVNVEMSGTTYWFGIYRYKDGYQQSDTITDSSGSSTYEKTIDEVQEDYYVVSCIYSSATITGITVTYTLDEEEVTLTYAYSNTKEEYVWTTSGGEEDPDPGTSTDPEDPDPGETDTGPYSLSQLVGVQTSTTAYYYGSYTVVYDSGTDSWSYTVEDLPQYVLIDGVKYTCYYFFVETGTSISEALYENATYSTKEGVNGVDDGGTITITNTVSETSTVTTLPESYSVDYTTMYEFGAMLILVSLVGAGAYRNISRIRKSLVEEPHRDGVDPGGTHERLPDVRNRKFVIPRIVRKGDTRAGPDASG